MNRVKYSQDTLKRVLCTFVFTLFSFFFLYFYQADLMTIIQHVLSEGQTHYNHFVGAVLITIVLLLIQVGVVRLFQRMRLAWAFTFVPSSLLLAMITDVRQSASAANGFLEFGWGGYVLPSCFILFFVVVWILNSSGIAEKYSMNSMNQTRQLWINLALVLLQMLFVCGWSNSDRVLHDRVHVEQCLADNDVDEALLTLQQQSDADENLTMLTAYSLSRKGELPERLFEFPLKGGSAALMPNGDNIGFGLLADTTFYAYLGNAYLQRMSTMHYLDYQRRHKRLNRRSVDYLLCAYLMDKKLDAFAHNITRYYEVNDSVQLPKHYKEALILYTHSHANPCVVLHDNVLDADFEDMQKLENSITDARERKTALRDTYGNTYWYYYMY